MSDSKFLRGTLILTLGTFFIKFLGIMYVIPFRGMVDATGAALYQYGYNPYTIFLSIATGGVPLAVSKFVSKYNELGQYKTSRKVFSSGLILLSLTGLLAFLVLYFLAPILAAQTVVDDTVGNSANDITMVIRMTAIALLIVPVQSIIRGYFQGFQQMAPTTLSQLVEQIVRIAFLLGATYYVLNVTGGEMATAIGWATFAAFVGAIGGLAVLLWYWYSQRGELNALAEQDTSGVTLSTWDMYKEIILSSIPFVLVGMTIPLYQQIDSLTFNNAMSYAGLADIAEESFGVLSMDVRQLSNIPVTIATAFSITLVPAITKLYIDNDKKLLQRQISQVYQIILFLTIPAAIGMSLLSYPLYIAFFGGDTIEIGGSLLAWAAPNAIFMSLFSISAAILQGVNRQKHAVIGTGLGVLAKLGFNTPMIYIFGAKGAAFSHAIGFTISIIYFIWQIKRYTNINFHFVFRRAFLILIFTGLMAVAVSAVMYATSFFFSYEAGRTQSMLILVPSVIVGVGIYVALSMKSGLLEIVFGKAMLDTIKRKVFRRG